jgi:PAS domain S-box-containing protein
MPETKVGLATEAPSRLQAILNISRDAIISISLEGTITAWNAAAERIFGYAHDEIVGKPLATLVPADRRYELASILERLQQGHVQETYETIRVRSDGIPIAVSICIASIGKGGRVTGAVAIVRDLSETNRALMAVEQSSAKLNEREQMLQRALSALRKTHEAAKSAQMQLVQAVKLESIGRLAAGVAHEVKNPLAVILFAVDYLKEAVPNPDENITIALTDAREAVIRADSVIRGLLDFSTATELTTDLQDINAVVRRSMVLVKHSFTKGHVFVVEELEEGLPPAVLDRNKIEQVLVNLMINAVDAMPEGGTLIVRTRKDRMVGGPEVGVRMTDTFRVGQSVIVIEIEDTGTGIDDKSKPRLFDPFYTTKPPGKGTGLGLAVCKSIVALHGGTVRVANKEGGGGARATVVLRSVRPEMEVPHDG